MSPITDHDEIAAWLARLLINAPVATGDIDEVAARLAPHVAAQIEAATTAEREATTRLLRRLGALAHAKKIERGDHL